MMSCNMVTERNSAGPPSRSWWWSIPPSSLGILRGMSHLLVTNCCSLSDDYLRILHFPFQESSRLQTVTAPNVRMTLGPSVKAGS